MSKFRAFTLVELLITMTLFSAVAILTVDILVSSKASEEKIDAKIFLYEEGEILMDQLVREIEQNTIDYEAYYLRNVQGETGWETQDYGFYAQSFYDPGNGGWYGGPYSSLADYYGVSCSSGGAYPDDCPTGVFTERFWRTIKYEDIFIKDYSSPREAEEGIRQYIHFYNHQRPHQSLNYKTPAHIYFQGVA